jgi:hypothetical protein
MDVLYKNHTTILIERFIFYKNKIQNDQRLFFENNIGFTII